MSVVQEAYVAGHERVEETDVARAVDGFGRALAVGLDDEQVRTLKQLRDKQAFVIRGERELSLLETGHVLIYGKGRFVVHPALLPLLDAIPEAA